MNFEFMNLLRDIYIYVYVFVEIKRGRVKMRVLEFC